MKCQCISNKKKKRKLEVYELPTTLAKTNELTKFENNQNKKFHDAVYKQ